MISGAVKFCIVATSPTRRLFSDAERHSPAIQAFFEREILSDSPIGPVNGRRLLGLVPNLAICSTAKGRASSYILTSMDIVLRSEAPAITQALLDMEKLVLVADNTDSALFGPNALKTYRLTDLGEILKPEYRVNIYSDSFVHSLDRPVKTSSSDISRLKSIEGRAELAAESQNPEIQTFLKQHFLDGKGTREPINGLEMLKIIETLQIQESPSFLGLEYGLMNMLFGSPSSQSQPCASYQKGTTTHELTWTQTNALKPAIEQMTQLKLIEPLQFPQFTGTRYQLTDLGLFARQTAINTTHASESSLNGVS